jgi:LuxR family maltose regulon positive regulatory protein
MSTLLTTKLRRPSPPAQRIQRPHLIQRLNDGLAAGRRMTLISAPPGFGKTTLLGEWIAALQRPIGWVSLDESDNDPGQFWSYVIAACQTIHPGIGATALALLNAPQPLPADSIPAILINDLAPLDDELLLVLDDYHVIRQPLIHDALAYLIDHLPDQLHLVLSTRIDPPWPLARLRARNQLSELRALDLRFTRDEAAAFLKQRLGWQLSAADIAALEARTEGWIAGLQLAALALQAPRSLQDHRDVAAFIQDFAGSHVYVAEYLVEEVLQRQSDVLQEFLLQTSLLDQLTAELCEAVTGCQDGQALLRQLHKANLFLIPLDDAGRWFRYHRLFADLLQARLQQTRPADVIAALHIRASGWYETTGMVNEAIQHAVAAADYATVVRLIESRAVEMLMQGYATTVESWLMAVPPELRFQSVQINLAFAWLHILRGTFAAATPYIERLHIALAGSRLNEASPSLQAEWLALQAYLLSAQGKLIESLELAQRACDLAPETDGYVQSLAYNALGSTYLMLNDYEQVVEIYQKAIQHGRAAANFLVEMVGISVLTQIATQHGQLHFAYELASQGVSRVERSGSPPALVAAVHGALGQIQYQWQHFAPARSHLQRAIQLCALSGYTAGEIYGRANLARLLQTEGHLATAMQESQKAIDLMQIGTPYWGGEEAIAQQVRVHLAQQQLAAAESLLAQHSFAFRDRFAFPDLAAGQPLTYAIGLLYDSALRLVADRARTQHDRKFLPAAIELADRLIDEALQNQYRSTAVETLLLRAQLHAAHGNDQLAWRDVARAVELAEPEGFISLFVEEGSPIAEALAALLKPDRLSSARTEYIKSILAAFPTGVPKPTAIESAKLVEQLTPRELEVLRLIAAGDSNQTIADKLVITVRTVKKHTGNIYGKLNAGNRTQAVARARELGLLSTD